MEKEFFNLPLPCQESIRFILKSVNRHSNNARHLKEHCSFKHFLVREDLAASRAALMEYLHCLEDLHLISDRVQMFNHLLSLDTLESEN